MRHDHELLEQKIERHFHLLLACRRASESGADRYLQALLGWIASSHEIMLSASLRTLGRRGGRPPRYADLMRAAVRLENGVRALDRGPLLGTARSLEELIRFCERPLARRNLAVEVVALLKADLRELREQLASVERARAEAMTTIRAAA